MDPRRLATVAGAGLVVIAAAALARAAGGLLPPQVALVVAFAVALLLPGWALAAASGLGRQLDAVALAGILPVAGLTAWIPAFAAGLAFGLTFDQVLAILAVQTVVLLAVGKPRPLGATRFDLATMAVLGLIAWLAATRWQASLVGDAVFHLARVQKLLALPHLSLDGLSELAGGRPHAGYVVPLLHAAEAGALRLSGITPAGGFQDLVPAAAVLIAVSSFAAGRAVAGTAAGAAVAAIVLWVSMTGAPHPTLGQASWPGPFTLLVLFPGAVLALTELIRRPGDRALQALVAASALVVALVHVTYAAPLLALMVGTVAFSRRGVTGVAAAAVAAMGVAGFVWWTALRGAPKPVVATGPWKHATHSAFIIERGHALAVNAVTITAGQAAFLVAVLAVVPLMAWKAPRFAYAAALSAGGLVLLALPGPVAFMNAVLGVGQTHRFGAAIPWQVVDAVLAALVVANARRRWVLPAAGLVVLTAVALSGHVESILDDAPALPTTAIAVAVLLGAAWYAVRGIRAVPTAPIPAATLPTVAVALVVVAFTAPTSAHTVASHLLHGHAAKYHGQVPAAITGWLAAHACCTSVVLANEHNSYQLGAHVSVYVVAVPEVRTRAEPASMPDRRRSEVLTFLSPATPQSARDALLRRYGVDVVVVRSGRAIVAQLRQNPLLHQRLKVPSPGGDWFVYTVSQAHSR